MFLHLHITTGFLSNFAIFGIGIFALLLASSQYAFAFKSDNHSDWFAALSATNLAYVFTVILYELFLFWGGYKTHINSLLLDVGVLIGIISIFYIWISSEGFESMQEFAKNKLRRKIKEEEDVPIQINEPMGQIVESAVI